MPFDLAEFKQELVNILRDNLTPQNLHGTIDVDLNKTSSIDLAQGVYFYSSVYRDTNYTSFPVDIAIKKTGSPPGSVIVDLMSSNGDPNQVLSSKTLPPSSIPTDYSSRTRFWISLSSIKQLGSFTEYFYRIRTDSTIDASNFYSVAKDSVNTHYLPNGAKSRTDGGSWSSISADLNFSSTIPNWIYPDYPDTELNIWSYPRIAVDITALPAVDNRLITHLTTYYEIEFLLVFYGRQPSELDSLLSITNRVLFRERINVPSIRELRPGNITPVTPVKEGIYARTAVYSGIYWMVADPL